MITSHNCSVKLKIALVLHSGNTWHDSTVILNRRVEDFNETLVLTKEHSSLLGKIISYDRILNICVSLLVISKYYATSWYPIVLVEDRWVNVELAVRLKRESCPYHWEVLSEIAIGNI